jgi:hypothetical protein
VSITNVLKGITGQIEIGRVSLVIGGFFAVTSPIAFEIWEMGWKGGHFDVTAWCLAYPGGLVVLVGGGVFAIGNKDKATASAQITRDTGTLPSPATPTPAPPIVVPPKSGE